MTDEDEANETSIWAYFNDIPIYVSTMCPKCKLFVTARKEYVGVLSIGSEITKTELQGAPGVQEAYYSELIGFGVFNDYAIVKVQFSEDGLPYNAHPFVILKDSERELIKKVVSSLNDPGLVILNVRDLSKSLDEAVREIAVLIRSYAVFDVLLQVQQGNV